MVTRSTTIGRRWFAELAHSTKNVNCHNLLRYSCYTIARWLHRLARAAYICLGILSRCQLHFDRLEHSEWLSCPPVWYAERTRVWEPCVSHARSTSCTRRRAEPKCCRCGSGRTWMFPRIQVPPSFQRTRLLPSSPVLLARAPPPSLTGL